MALTGIGQGRPDRGSEDEVDDGEHHRDEDADERQAA